MLEHFEMFLAIFGAVCIVIAEGVRHWRDPKTSGFWLGTMTAAFASLLVGIYFQLYDHHRSTRDDHDKIIAAIAKNQPNSTAFHGSTTETFAALNRLRATSKRVVTTKLAGQAPRSVNLDGSWGAWKHDSPELKAWYTGVAAWLNADNQRTFKRFVTVTPPEMRAWNDKVLQEVGLNQPRFEHVAVSGEPRPTLNATVFDGLVAVITFSHSRDANRYSDLRSIEIRCAEFAAALESGYFQRLERQSVVEVGSVK